MKVGLLSLLGTLFVGLKLGGVISWSWWWVTVPFWGVFAIFASIMVLGLIVAAFRAALKVNRRK